MLVIGHRGAKGKGPRNTIEAMRYALSQGADGLEFDVRLTQDEVPVIIHDNRLLYTRGINRKVQSLTYAELRELTHNNPIPTLADVLDAFWGKTLLNIELKTTGSAAIVIGLLASRYIVNATDWEKCLIASFKVRELKAARRMAPHARLALLHGDNPYRFILYQRSLKFAALGFHRHYTSLICQGIAQRLGIFTYAYTVNQPKGARLLRDKQIDAVITDYPRRIITELK